MSTEPEQMNTETAETREDTLRKVRLSVESAQRRDLITSILRNSGHANLSAATCSLLANRIYTTVVAPLEPAPAPQPAPDADKCQCSQRWVTTGEPLNEATGHYDDCAEALQCDACGKFISGDERRGGIRAGAEGAFCPECCGEKPAPDAGGEWRVVPEPVAPDLAAIQADGLIIASCMTTKTANQIVRDHTRAAAVPRLVEALKAAVHAMKSYYYGNSSMDLMIEVDSATDAVLVEVYNRVR
jgi:hypothetical protein